MPLMAEENPEAKPQSRATVGEPRAGLPLTAAGAEEIRVTFPPCCDPLADVFRTWLRADGGSILREGADSRLGSIADRCDTPRESWSKKRPLSFV